jgi:hypothetical protein
VKAGVIGGAIGMVGGTAIVMADCYFGFPIAHYISNFIG